MRAGGYQASPPRTPEPKHSHEDARNIFGNQERARGCQAPCPDDSRTKRKIPDTFSAPSDETDKHRAVAESTNGEVEELTGNDKGDRRNEAAKLDLVSAIPRHTPRSQNFFTAQEEPTRVNLGNCNHIFPPSATRRDPPAEPTHVAQKH